MPSEKIWKVSAFVRHKTDETYLEQRDKTMHNAISKWHFLVLVNTAHSEVGRQLEETPIEQVDLVLSSVMGVKSPGLKGAVSGNTLLATSCNVPQPQGHSPWYKHCVLHTMSWVLTMPSIVQTQRE